MTTTSPRLDALRARASAAKLAAEEKALSPDDEEAKRLLDEEAEHLAAARTAEATRRRLDMEERLARARAAAGASYLCTGIDLYSLFDADALPPPDHMPTGGVIIIRNVTPDAEAKLSRAIEEHKVSIEDLFADVVRATLIDPNPDTPEAARFGHVFMPAYAPAVKQIATKARELGGAKSRQGPRGRA